MSALCRARDESATTDTRAAIETLIAHSAPSAWLWVFELVQNALDAGAKKIRIAQTEQGVRFEHDGSEPLEEKHVTGIAGLGRSTKGLTTVGFMGVGFKSVFHRFRRVAVSSGPWRFRFEIRVTIGFGGARIPEWFDAVRPFWDDELGPPSEGFTTRFELERPESGGEAWRQDIAHLASAEDSTPLAVLGLRGLKSLDVLGTMWRVCYDEPSRTVAVSGPGGKRRWLVLRVEYTPSEAALRRFVEVRRTSDLDAASKASTAKRAVVGFVQLDEKGRPLRRSRGHAFSTLPTAETLPFAIDVQADWLVDLARQGLRDIAGDAWQEDIVAQVPALLRSYAEWLGELPREHLSVALDVLASPEAEESRLAAAFSRPDFIERVRAALCDCPFIPVLVGGASARATGPEARGLPREFDEPFATTPAMRADALFGSPVLDASTMGERSRAFLGWLGWVKDIGPGDVDWPLALEAWWAERSPEEARERDLWQLWNALANAPGWETLPSVRTAANTWVAPGRLRRFNESPPDEDQPGGALVKRALGDRVARPDETLPGGLRAMVNTTSSPAAALIKRHEKVELLADAILAAYQRLAKDEDRDDEAFLVLPIWALSRGSNRHDLVPLVLTASDGPRAPGEVLLGCDGVPAAEARRALFPGLPVLDARYLESAPDRASLLAFLAAAGLRGGAKFLERCERVADAATVAAKIGVAPDAIGGANSYGYNVHDTFFGPSFEPERAPAALCSWLEAEWSSLLGRGHKRATWKNYGLYERRGHAPASWVTRLESIAWVPCEDGALHRPTQVLRHPTPDRDDAPVANIAPGLVSALAAEGLRWGHEVPPTATLRRLSQPGRQFSVAELTALLDESLTWIAAHPEDRGRLVALLPDVHLEGRPLSRWVRAVGQSGTARSRLDDWVAALPGPLAERLSRVPGYAVAETTTSAMALGFLRHVWSQVESGVDLKREQRAFLRPAYSYVTKDPGVSAELQAHVLAHPERVFFYAGEDKWVPASTRPVVDDAAVERLHKLLCPGRPRIRPSHFVEGAADDLAIIASMLGLDRLSVLADGQLHCGTPVGAPPYEPQLRELVGLLARSDDTTPPLTEIEWVASISLRIGGTSVEFGARLDDEAGSLCLVAGADRWAPDLVPLLVSRYRLSQNGAASGMLALSIATVADPLRFGQNLRRLATLLEVDLADGSDDAAGAKLRSQAAPEGAPPTPGEHQPSQEDASPAQPPGSQDDDAEHEDGRAGDVEFAGQSFSSVDAAITAFESKVAALACRQPTKATVLAPRSDRVARQPANGASTREGSGRFSKRSAVVGRLGEKYALRWLREALANGWLGSQRAAEPAASPDVGSTLRIIDVSSPEAREMDGFPASYHKPDPAVSPGCDLLVFENGENQLPVGYEIKSRGDNGPIEFEWTRREHEACRRAGNEPRDPHWPLSGYRVLVISDLLADGKEPDVVVLGATDCLEGAEAMSWVVRASAEP